MTTACGTSAPTAPGGTGTALTITCSAPTILVPRPAGIRRRSNHRGVDVERSERGKVGGHRGLSRQAGGQATLTASYAGQSNSAVVTVRLEDVLRVTGGAFQGTFTVGTTATPWLQGFYGVASADSGNLMLVVTDQTGAAISATAQTVPRGAERY